MLRASGKEKEKKKEEKRKEPKEKRRKKKSKRNIYIIPTVLYPARAEATFRSELFLTFNFPDSRNLFWVDPKDRMRLCSLKGYMSTTVKISSDVLKSDLVGCP